MRTKTFRSYSKYWNELYFDHVLRQKPEPRPFDAERYHQHKRYELYYLHSGNVTQFIEDRKYVLKGRDLVLVNSDYRHCITVDSSAQYEHFVIVFDPDTLSVGNMRYWPKDTEVINCQNLPVITDLFQKLDYYYTTIHTDELRDIVALIITEILYNIGYTNRSKQDQSNDAHPLISAALDEIHANLFSINCVDDVAKKLYVTRGYLSRIFKQELNTTPLRYITEKKLTAAQDMILQGMPPTKVYTQCGFTDYTTFYRNYVKAFGHPPSK